MKDRTRILAAISVALIAGWFIRVLSEAQPDLFRPLGVPIMSFALWALSAFALGGRDE